MISEYMDVGKFLPHWQIAFVLIVALIVGTVAYKAKVGHAREKQNKALQRAESGAQAVETLKMAGQIEGILSTVIDNIDATAKLADTWVINAQNFEAPAIRRRVASPPLFSLTPQLDKLGPEISKSYLQLCDQISAFRTEPAQAGSSGLQHELELLRKITQPLQRAISESRDHAQDILTEAPSVTGVVAQSV